MTTARKHKSAVQAAQGRGTVGVVSTGRAASIAVAAVSVFSLSLFPPPLTPDMAMGFALAAESLSGTAQHAHEQRQRNRSVSSLHRRCPVAFPPSRPSALVVPSFRAPCTDSLRRRCARHPRPEFRRWRAATFSRRSVDRRRLWQRGREANREKKNKQRQNNGSRRGGRHQSGTIEEK